MAADQGGPFYFLGVFILDETGATETGSIELKKPTTYQEQIEIIRSRGLIIPNEHKAIEILKKVNYYRLSAYFLSLRQDGTNLFKPGTTFDKIYRLYEFDTKLRNLLMEFLEGIEIEFRTNIAYKLAHTYGAIGYKESTNFVNEDYHSRFIADFQKEQDRQKELFVRHHAEKYQGQLPIWVAVEIMSFGMLSTLYANLKPQDQKKIADKYGVRREYVQSWLKVLSYVRNICAHFGRLYNKNLTTKPRLFKEDYRDFSNNKVFAPIFIMRRLISSPDDWRSFLTKLDALIEQNMDVIELSCIGFPVNWNNLFKENRA